VLQGVAGCCRVLQGVAGCCRVLQGVAGCLKSVAAPQKRCVCERCQVTQSVRSSRGCGTPTQQI